MLTIGSSDPFLKEKNYYFLILKKRIITTFTWSERDAVQKEGKKLLPTYAPC